MPRTRVKWVCGIFYTDFTIELVSCCKTTYKRGITMIIDKFENLPLYFSCLPGLDRAAEFLAGEDIADGHYEIDGEKYSQTCRAMSQRSLTAICALRRIKIRRSPGGSRGRRAHRLGAARLAQGRERGIFKGRRHSILQRERAHESDALGGRISYSVSRRRAQALHPQRRKSEESGSKARAVKRAFG